MKLFHFAAHCAPEMIEIIFSFNFSFAEKKIEKFSMEIHFDCNIAQNFSPRRENVSRVLEISPCAAT
jgi:hypothetical protein